MKVELNSVPPILVDYMEKHVLPKAAGPQKFITGAAMFALGSRAQLAVTNERNISLMRVAGLLGEDNLIDVDYARDMALAGMKHAGGKINVMGFVMDDSDIEAIYEISKVAAR